KPDATSYRRRGIGYRLKGDNDRAIADWRRSLELDRNQRDLDEEIANLSPAKKPAVAASAVVKPEPVAVAKPEPVATQISPPVIAPPLPDPGRRVALVIGNDRYANLAAEQQLQKAVNDSRAVGSALARVGFEVIDGENLARSALV